MINWLWFSVFQGFYLAYLFVRFMYQVVVPKLLGPLMIWYVYVSVSAFLASVNGWDHVKGTMVQRWINRELEDKELTLDKETDRRKAIAVKAEIWLWLGFAINGWLALQVVNLIFS